MAVRLPRFQPVALVEQARHVAFLHEGAGAGEGLGAELLCPDVSSQEVLERTDGGDDAALLGRESLDALGVCGRLGLEQRRVEVHQAAVVRDEREVAVLLEHLGEQQL